MRKGDFFKLFRARSEKQFSEAGNQLKANVLNVDLVKTYGKNYLKKCVLAA